MSHFAIVVIGTAPAQLEAALEPFNEATELPEHRVFRDEEDAYRKQYEEETVEMVRLADGTLRYTWDDAFKRGPLLEQTTEYPAGSALVQVPHPERYATFEDFMRDFCGYSERDADTGRYGRHHNPNGHWDWYQVGGRWSGFFKLKTGAEGELGQPGIFNHQAPSGTADVLTLADWDLAGQRDEAARRAAAHYHAFFALMGTHALPPSWESVREAHGDNIEAARNAYWAHPSMVHLKAADTRRVFGGFDSDPGEEFSCSLETYEDRARQRVGVPFAVLKDGQWMSRGKMHMFGMSTDEMTETQWCEFVSKLYDALPPDTLLSIVDCHV